MDIRDLLFEPLKGKLYIFKIEAREEGILAGVKRLLEEAKRIGLDVDFISEDGVSIKRGDVVFCGKGDAWQVAMAEERLLGLIGKVSGIATASALMVKLAGGRIRVVCGAWKKVPLEVRQDFREAIKIGGAGIRVLEEPFIYLDKNYIRMFGGLAPAIRKAKEIKGRVIVVQLRGDVSSLEEEAIESLREGAGVLMVDTGRLKDLVCVKKIVLERGFKERVKVAFSGGVKADDIENVIEAGADIVDVGRAIIDAPLLDFSLDVIRS
ncbi:MAG: nicotinate-nucleotide pyrophosphorylase [Synergistetes bacterium]|nr:nicotinate-nucleotide pyrophosphorylase [Synergistota bacterium]MCX8127126.1 nicotinate-nucleotide pyrophosphorylase [Synergistota bacterium]MDW8191987.1 nicotinate-nucleotide pyrophosphorylase [Synergistota bacterium]